MSKGKSGLFGIIGRFPKIAAPAAKKTPLSGLSDYQKDLIKEVQARGDKITPENVLDIGKTQDGRIIWMETGNDDAGLNHILLKHGTEFTSEGFTPTSLSKFIVNMVLTGKPIGYAKTKNATPREVYQISLGGETRYIAITVGPNGFIVGINFINERRIRWNKSK